MEASSPELQKPDISASLLYEARHVCAPLRALTVVSALVPDMLGAPLAASFFYLL